MEWRMGGLDERVVEGQRGKKKRKKEKKKKNAPEGLNERTGHPVALIPFLQEILLGAA